MSYTIWPLLKAETTRKDVPIDPQTPSPWYTNKDMAQANRLTYLIFFPSISLTQIFRNLAALSHFKIFGWLGMAALFVFVVTDIMSLVLIFKGYRQRARERAMR